MLSLLRQSLLVFLALTVLTGVVYPLLMTGFAQLLFPYQADGSLIERNGQVVGSKLIGQQFDDPGYFWVRPSATSPPFNAAASTGSNFGPTNPAQLEATRTRVENIRATHPNQSERIPIDLVTASGSGLDPHISPAAAEYQVARVSQARGLELEKVRGLVSVHTEGRQLGVLGEPRVNVLSLNLALDELTRPGD
jgi:potassium-transporting ATPase KdpC subunit